MIMMPLSPLLSFILLIGLATIRESYHSYTAMENNLTIEVTNLKNKRGKLMISLFNSEKGFPQDTGQAYKLAMFPLNEAKGNTFTLRDLPSGTYALAVYHDENNNGKLDTNKLGIPTEGYGFSNNAYQTFGPAPFTDASFSTTSTGNLTIKLKY
jgi:uncharacterized protein (DUF2141 family)